MNRKNIVAVAVMGALAIAMLLLITLTGAPASAAPGAAPAAAVTPVASVNARGPETARVLTFFNAEVVTVDTRRCFDASMFETLDFQYVIDETLINTVTLKIQHSNDNATYTDGATTASAVTADGNGMAQYALFGRWNCIHADVGTANPITITAIGVAK